MPTFGQQADHPKNMTVIAEVEITFRHHVRKLFPTQVLTQQSAQNSLLRFQRIWGHPQRFAERIIRQCGEGIVQGHLLGSGGRVPGLSS
ncbi:hypothetical protein D3C87_1785830 [compost metagenome]